MSLDSAVRVGLRIKPIDSIDCEKCVQQSDKDPNVLIISEDRVFPFDIIFGEDSSQKDVYENLVKPQTEKLLNGYNCASLAYGQTGTGKSYSMGLHEKSIETEQAGIVHRVLEDVFLGAETKYGENGWKISVSFIEIYNEKVYDLLSQSSEPLKGLYYKSKDIEKCEVGSVDEAIQILKITNGNRHIRKTPLNPSSSRSHAIFTVRISIRDENVVRESSLHLVDLAGSEGVKRTGHQGIALSEGNHINQGLLAVGKVLAAMSNGNQRVPYRDSVLTQVLQESLNSNCFITLLACISPSASNLNETLTTLRFAQNTKQLKTTPQINEIINELKKGKTPSKYGPPLRSIHNNRYVTPGKRPFSMASAGISTIKKQNLQFPNQTICTPSKRKRMEFEPLNSTTFEIPQAPVLSVEEFFHPDNFRNAIEIDNRASVSSVVSGINISASTEIEQPPSMRSSILSVNTPVEKQMTFSPLLQKLSNLENAFDGKLQKLYETMNQNQTMHLPTSTPRVAPRNNDDTLNIPGMDMIRKELQQIVRNELANFTMQLPQNMTLNNVPPQRNTNGDKQNDQTDEGVQKNIPEIEVINVDETSNIDQNFLAPEPVRTSRPTTRRSKRLTADSNNIPLRRSARLSSVPRPTIQPVLEIKERSRSTSRRRDKIEVQNKEIPLYLNKNGELANPKVAKSKHIAAVFELLNNGNIKDLQRLPKIGYKTAYQIVTTRLIKGRYKSIKEIGKLPMWKGKQWQTFLEANHLD
uniref:Kinesin-like protein n=1 Tax=Culicoides sonorensis TaxID=179676 RepID=A0A336LY24_CULSO